MNITYKNKDGSKTPYKVNKNYWGNGTVKPEKKSKTSNKPLSTKTVGTQTIIQKKIVSNNEECCICFETDWVCRSSCNHFICVNCIVQIKKQCPICRADLSAKLPNILKPISKMSKEESLEISIFSGNNLNAEIPNIYDISEFPNL